MSTETNLNGADTDTTAFLGMTNRIIGPTGHTDGSLSVVEITVPPGVGAPPHTNQREALTWYVIEGELTFFEGQTPTTRTAGELIFSPAGAPHTFLNQGDREARALMICTPGGFEGFLADAGHALPAEAPDGPPEQAHVQIMVRLGAEYGLQFHLAQ